MSSTVPKPSARRSRSGSSIHKGQTPFHEDGNSVPVFGKRGLSPVFVRVLPFGLFIALLAAQPLLEPSFDGRWIAVVRGLAVGALLVFLWPRFVELREAPALRASEWAAALATGLGVFVAWINLDRGWMTFGGGQGFVPLRPDGSLDPWLVALRFLVLAAIVPVMEELFWRSFLLRWIDKRDFLAASPRNASALAVVATAVLFASEHALWLAGLAAGLIYTALYVGTGNLRTCVISHALTNGLLGVWIVATRDWRLW